MLLTCCFCSLHRRPHNITCYLILCFSDPNDGLQPAAAEGSGEALPGGLTDADLESNWDEAIETFDAMDIPEELLRGIYSYGFEKPSAIQQRAIKPTMMGRDLIAQAQSGTVRAVNIGNQRKKQHVDEGG